MNNPSKPYEYVRWFYENNPRKMGKSEFFEARDCKWIKDRVLSAEISLEIWKAYCAAGWNSPTWSIQNEAQYSIPTMIKVIPRLSTDEVSKYDSPPLNPNQTREFLAGLVSKSEKALKAPKPLPQYVEKGQQLNRFMGGAR